MSTAAYPCSGQVWTETWDSAITTMPLMPKGLNWWKWVPTMVAFAILAAATKISSTLFTSFRSLGLQPFNSSTKCRPSACNSFATFRWWLYRAWPTYRLSPLPLRETTGKAHDTRKLCVNIAELFQLSINFFRGASLPSLPAPSSLPAPPVPATPPAPSRINLCPVASPPTLRERQLSFESSASRSQYRRRHFEFLAGYGDQDVFVRLTGNSHDGNLLHAFALGEGGQHIPQRGDDRECRRGLQHAWTGREADADAGGRTRRAAGERPTDYRSYPAGRPRDRKSDGVADRHAGGGENYRHRIRRAGRQGDIRIARRRGRRRDARHAADRQRGKPRHEHRTRCTGGERRRGRRRAGEGLAFESDAPVAPTPSL